MSLSKELRFRIPRGEFHRSPMKSTVLYWIDTRRFFKDSYCIHQLVNVSANEDSKMKTVDQIADMLAEDDKVAAPEVLKVMPQVRTGPQYVVPSWLKQSVKEQSRESKK